METVNNGRQNIPPFVQRNSAFIIFKKLLYLILFLIALTIYAMQRLQMSLPTIINNYVNDLLFLPLTLGAITCIIRWLKKDVFFELSFVFVLLLSGFYSFYFEYYLPQFNSRYTADWIDVILYFSGAFAYFFIEKMEYRRFSE